MAEYHHATYTPTEDEMREAWVYMQWVESVAGKEIGEAQAANFFAERNQQTRADVLEVAAQVVQERGAAYGVTAYRLLGEKAYADSSRYSNYASGLAAAAVAIRALATPITDTKEQD